MQETEKELFAKTHPDVYVVPWMPGGSKFMRNPPLPVESCFEGEIPEDVVCSPVSAVNIDMSPLPVKRVLVDFSNKTY